MAVKIKWVPGHEDIKGNEDADVAAKNAAMSEGSNSNIRRSDHKPLKSARSLAVKREIENKWNVAWTSQCHDWRQLRYITKEPNTRRGVKLYSAASFTRPQIAQLARLRTVYCSLNQYLYRFGHVESPTYECGNGAIENVEHFLLHCPQYEAQRAK
jgi:hypothetical protein